MPAPAPDEGDSFLTVAGHLVAAIAPGGDEASWRACENARARAAVSRAYYAAFIALKLRVLPHLRRSNRRFPSDGAHRRVVQAW